MLSGDCAIPMVESQHFAKSPYWFGNLKCHSGEGGAAWWLRGLNNNGNATFDTVKAHMNALAGALTDRLRFENYNASDSTTFAQGTVMKTTVCIRFVWPWLMAIFLLLITVFFFVVVAWPTRKQNDVPMWENSMLPLVYATLEEPESTNAHSIKAMDDAAAKTEVQLVRENEGAWNLGTQSMMR